MPKRLYRSHDRMLGGVAAGLAEYLGLDVALVRLLWVIGVLVTGVVPGLVAYAAAWIIIPEAAHPPAAGPRGPDRSNGGGAGSGAPTSGGSGGSGQGSRGHSPRPEDRDTAPEAPAGDAGASGAGPPDPAPGWPAPEPAQPDRPARADGGRTVAALVLIAVGAFSLLKRVLPWFTWDLIWPLALIGGGAYLLMGGGKLGR